MKKITALLLLFLTLSSCERDDICDEGKLTTPRLVIDFKDLINPESPKNVFGFRAEDADDTTHYLDDYNDITTNTVILPLKTNEDTTQFALYKDYNEVDDNGTPDDETDDIDLTNRDVITITYAREEIYVSRACGYKTIFKNVLITLEDDGDNWIQLIQSVNDNQSIEDETTTHFNILH